MEESRFESINLCNVSKKDYLSLIFFKTKIEKGKEHNKVNPFYKSFQHGWKVITTSIIMFTNVDELWRIRVDQDDRTVVHYSRSLLND